MVANALTNVKLALEGHPVIEIYGWLGSSVALHGILNDNRKWKQFVSNRVKEINKRSWIIWRHCPTNQNPDDIGSRGIKNGKIPQIWFNSPTWLAKKNEWPPNIAHTQMEEVMKEVNPIKMHNFATVERFNYFELMNKYQLPNVIRIMAWILRIIINLKSKRKCRGVLSATERNNAMQKLIKIAQYEFEKSEQYKETLERLRLH